MVLSELLNWILGGGFVTTLIALLTLKSTALKAKSEAEKARAEAERAKADAETVRITNAEQATRILVENIVEPLKKELNATRREMARLRKALNQAGTCDHSANCPVLHELRLQKDSYDHRGNQCDEDEEGQDEERGHSARGDP